MTSLTRLFLLTFVMGALTFACALAQAQTHTHSHHGHSHTHSDGAPHEEEVVQPPKTIGEAETLLREAVGEAEAALEKQQLEEIHHAEPEITAALKTLQVELMKTPSRVSKERLKPNPDHYLDADDNRARLASAIKQALGFAEALHGAADANDLKKAQTEFKKLKGALQLIETHSRQELELLPKLQEDRPGYACPMHPEVTSPEQDTCSKCGMRMIRAKAIKPGVGRQAPIVNVQARIEGKDGVLEKGKPATVTLRFTSKVDGKPITLDQLQEMHTEKIHLLIIDPALSDYHHEHPKPTSQPGEYTFTFTPRTEYFYRIWADIVPTATSRQEYAMTDLPAMEQPPSPETNFPTRTLSNLIHGSPIHGMIDSKSKMQDRQDDYNFTLSASRQPHGFLMRITDSQGKIVDQLEPVMGAYAHIVGFHEDYKTVIHAHPMGPEPRSAQDRGKGELQFDMALPPSGFTRLFVQVCIKGKDYFASFGLPAGSMNQMPKK